MILKEYDINVLILFDANSLHVKTIKEHLESFRLYSRLRIYYDSATVNAECKYNFFLFDVIVIHYTVRLCLTDYISPAHVEQLKGFGGYKILFIQDEYESTETARKWIEDLGIHCIYTCVPKEFVNKVYPRERFPMIDFVNTLTGYVPRGMETKANIKSLESRPFLIGYRGRKLPYWYGSLGQEKLVIGMQMKKICDLRGLKTDIEWDEAKRIYGEDWYNFLQSCRATLGTESGSNVFDDYGKIMESIKDALQKNPEFTYNEAFECFLRPHEGKILMNQISPKIFEAISCHTALILFEGSYSNVLEPNLHYIPLKKNFSNVDTVLKKINDIDYLNDLTERAYSDIVVSEKYSYKKFISEFDQLILKKIKICEIKTVKFISPVQSKTNLFCTSIDILINRKKLFILKCIFIRNEIFCLMKRFLPVKVLNYLRAVRAFFCQKLC